MVDPSVATFSSYRAGRAPLLLQKGAHSPPSYIDHVHSPVIAGSFADQRSSRIPRISSPLSAHELTPYDFRPGLAGSQHGMSQASSISEEGLRPYLGLSARMFLSLFSAPIVALILTATSLLMSSRGIDRSVAQAKEKLLTACQAVEMEASMVASLPHWLADAMNERTSQVLTDTVHGVGRVLSLALTAVENLLVFLADSYRSLFQCFIELLIRGSLALLMAAVSLLNSAVRETASAIETVIQGSVSAINAFLSATISGLNDVLSVIGRSISIPTVAQPDLSALNNVSLPASFEGALLSLNSSLPTLDQLKMHMDELIQTPFVALRDEVNGTVSSFAFSSALLPVPEIESITLCNDIDLSTLDDFAHALRRLLYILGGILALAVLICIAVQLLKAWYSWRCLNRQLERIQSAWQHIDPRSTSYRGGKCCCSGFNEGCGDSEPSPLSSFLSRSHLFTLISLSQHPLLSSISFKLSEKLGLSSIRSQNGLRWWLAFVSHPMAVTFLALGLSGLAASQVQLWALNPVQEHYQSSLDLSTSAFAERAVAQINGVTLAASEGYANRTNALILAAQDGLNERLFAWVNTTTAAMNSSINALQSGLSEAMDSTFASTPLYTTVQTFLQCTILSKLEAVEAALTWMSDNASVNFSLVPLDVLALSTNHSQEAVSRITRGEDGEEGSSAIFSKISQEYREKLEMERLMFAVILASYGLLIVVGTLIAAFAGEGRRSSTTGRGSFLKWFHRGWKASDEQEASVRPGLATRSDTGPDGGMTDEDEKVVLPDAESMLRSHNSITAPIAGGPTLEEYDLSEGPHRARWLS